MNNDFPVRVFIQTLRQFSVGIFGRKFEIHFVYLGRCVRECAREKDAHFGHKKAMKRFTIINPIFGI